MTWILAILLIALLGCVIAVFVLFPVLFTIFIIIAFGGLILCLVRYVVADYAKSVRKTGEVPFVDIMDERFKRFAKNILRRGSR